jgi:hypothetical protein
VDRRSCVDIAISSAMAILRTVLDEPDIRKALVGVPLYLHTMIACAAAFLLKMQLKWKTVLLDANSTMIYDLVNDVIKLLRDVKASERHLTYHIAKGLRKMSEKFRNWEKYESGNGERVQTRGDGNTAAPAVGYDLTTNVGQYGIYDESPDVFGEDYFPTGFFDVLSSWMPD